MNPPRPGTVLEALQAARQAGDKRGFTFVGSDGNEHTLGFATLAERAFERGNRLRSFGLVPGDRVALAIPDAEEFVLTFLGAVSAGLVPVPLYPPLSLARLDAYLDGTTRTLNAARANLLVTTDQVQRVLWSVVARVPTLRDLVTVEKLETISAPAVPAPEVKPGDTLFLQFTSGSTAAPRGVVVTHASLLANVRGIMEEGLAVDVEVDKAVSWLPLYHDMGLIGFVFAPLIYGLTTIFIPTISFLKRPSLWMEIMNKHRASLSFAPNFAYARLAKRANEGDLARWDLSCIRMLGCGAEPIHSGTMRAFVERFAAAKLRPEVMLPSYGMAEATLAMSFIGLKERVRIDAVDPDACYGKRHAIPTDASASVEFVSCGRPFAGHELGIFDSHGKRLREREIGEIRFRGPSVAAGYYRDEVSTKASFVEDGWLRTGDLGYLADGDLFISGREKDILIVHGHNYYPQAIEWLAEEVPGIRKGNVVAFSVPGAMSEEVVIVAETSERTPEAKATVMAAVARHVNEEMGLSVKEVALLGPGELPKTSSGKLQRRKTREQYLAGTLGSEGVRSPGSAAERLSIARHLLKSFYGRVKHRFSRRSKIERSPEA